MLDHFFSWLRFLVAIIFQNLILLYLDASYKRQNWFTKHKKGNIDLFFYLYWENQTQKLDQKLRMTFLNVEDESGAIRTLDGIQVLPEVFKLGKK